jgi:hypothetical protein
MQVQSTVTMYIVCQEVAGTRKEMPHAVCRMRERPLGLGFQEPGSNRSWVAAVKSRGEKRQEKRCGNMSDVSGKDECE